MDEDGAEEGETETIQRAYTCLQAVCLCCGPGDSALPSPHCGSEIIQTYPHCNKHSKIDQNHNAYI